MKRNIKVHTTHASESAKQLQNLVIQIQELLELEYKRGAAASLESLVNILGGSIDTAELPPRPARASRGAARAFVEKNLTKTPQSIAQLRAEAKTASERQLSYQTVRLELERGRNDKRYKKTADKKWSV